MKVLFVRRVSGNGGLFHVGQAVEKLAEGLTILEVPAGSTNVGFRSQLVQGVVEESKPWTREQHNWSAHSLEKVGERYRREVLLFGFTVEDARAYGEKNGLEIGLLKAGVYV